MEQKPFIKNFGLFTTLICATIGMNILYFPVNISKSMNNNGWYVTILLTLAIYFFCFIIFKLYEKYDINSINELFSACVGSFLSKILILLLGVFSMMYVGIVLNNFSKVIKLYLFPKSPVSFFIITMAILIFYGIKNDVRGMVRFNEVSFFIIFIPMAVVFSICLNKGDYSNLLPFKIESFSNILKGLKSSFYIFTGVEILYLYLPYVSNKKTAGSVLKKSILFICIFNLIIYFLCLFAFGSNHIKILLNPSLTLIRVVDIPGSFLERWEGIVISFWIFYCFASCVNMAFFTKEIFINTFNIKKSIALFVILIVVVVFSIGDEITSFFTNFYNNNFYIYQIICYLLIPIILSIILKLKEKKVAER